jgi:hypothetical protein
MDNEVEIEVEKIPRALAKQFFGRGEVRGFSFTQLAENDHAYLYEVEEPCGAIHYEVFQKKIDDRFNTMMYPKSNSFGKWAFSLQTLDLAYDYFKAMST